MATVRDKLEQMIDLHMEIEQLKERLKNGMEEIVNADNGLRVGVYVIERPNLVLRHKPILWVVEVTERRDEDGFDLTLRQAGKLP